MFEQSVNVAPWAWPFPPPRAIIYPTVPKGSDAEMHFVGHPLPLAGIFFGVLMVVFWLLVLVALVLLIRYLWLATPRLTEGNSARALLEERYARGEIGKEEFDQKRRDLR